MPNHPFHTVAFELVPPNADKGPAERVEEAFERYERARRERAAFVVLQSRNAGKMFHAVDTDSYHERTRGKAADEGIGLFSYNPVTQLL